MFNTLTIWLVAIIILLYAYVYVWSRGPQDGKLWRMIRRLRKTERYWRKRALRDEAILSRVIDKKTLALVAFLCLFLIPVVNPDMSSIPAAMADEPFMVQETPFLTASDGDESDESLTAFSETLADDVMFYPDSFFNGTVFVANTGNYSGTQINTYTNTQNDDTASWFVYDDTSPYDAYAILNFTIPTFDYTIDSIRITTDTIAKDYNLIDFIYYNISVYNHGTKTWNLQYTNINDTEFTTRYTTLGDVGYFSDTVLVKIHSTNYTSLGPVLTWEYSCVEYGYMTLADSDHYAEGFTDVSDWATAATISTDGDVMLHEGDGGQRTYTNDISLASMIGYYVEYRLKSNRTHTTGKGRLFAYHGDDKTGGYAFYDNVAWTTSWATYRAYIPHTKGYDAGALECVSFASDYDNTKLELDYLRIARADEMGWAHDGSTTAATRVYTAGAGSATITSDGDEWHISGTYSNFAGIIIETDDTTTQSDLKLSDYPFLEWNMNASTSQDIILAFWDENFVISWYSGYVETNTFTTTSINIEALITGDYVNQIGIYDTNDNAQDFYVDWVKAYSIANYTVTQSGVTIDDYLYVDSGILYSNIDDGYIELNHDPALSVSDTYSVWNLTTSGTAPEFADYVSEWSSYSDETRGATTSGTVTDIKLKFDSTETLSAIKFIEDGTAPDIIDKFIGPPEPDDSEAVTITAVTYDAIEVYEVTINAVVYPTGFSDVDYDMTEQTDDVLWSYEFSTLAAGYYLFQVTASDGANTYSEYIPVTVRESAIEITTYTFFGASSDFDYMQYSGHISHDCTYNITEVSDSYAATETHTGSVTEGMFNIAWNKITVDDESANFTIVFMSGTLSLTIEGYYGTAYKLLRITEIEVLNMEESLALTNITINFYTNKDVDWYVYDRDNDDAVLSSGSSTEGSDDLYFLKNRIPYAHYYAVKWTDGVTDIWYNSSYWTYRQNLDSINPPGVDWGAKDDRKTIEFWVTISTFIGIGGFIVLGIMHYDTREKLKKLQLPSYRTQERDRK